MATLGDVLDARRWHGFVGRTAELAGFDDALAGRSACRVLFVHGPGGVGKTTLRLHLRSRAERAGRSASYLDGRDVDPSPDGFVHAEQAAGAGQVLLVDGYEELAPIDDWVRRDLLPTLPTALAREAEDYLIGLAGEQAPKVQVGGEDIGPGPGPAPGGEPPPQS